VGFEWHERGVDLEIEVLPSGEVSFFFDRLAKDDSEEHSGPLDQCASAIRDRIQKHLTER
jgi:hypothetical protein